MTELILENEHTVDEYISEKKNTDKIVKEFLTSISLEGIINEWVRYNKPVEIISEDIEIDKSYSIDNKILTFYDDKIIIENIYG